MAPVHGWPPGGDRNVSTSGTKCNRARHRRDAGGCSAGHDPRVLEPRCCARVSSSGRRVARANGRARARCAQSGGRWARSAQRGADRAGAAGASTHAEHSSSVGARRGRGRSGSTCRRRSGDAHHSDSNAHSACRPRRCRRAHRRGKAAQARATSARRAGRRSGGEAACGRRWPSADGVCCGRSRLCPSEPARFSQGRRLARILGRWCECQLAVVRRRQVAVRSGRSVGERARRSRSASGTRFHDRLRDPAACVGSGVEPGGSGRCGRRY